MDGLGITHGDLFALDGGGGLATGENNNLAQS